MSRRCDMANVRRQCIISIDMLLYSSSSSSSSISFFFFFLVRSIFYVCYSSACVCSCTHLVPHSTRCMEDITTQLGIVRSNVSHDWSIVSPHLTPVSCIPKKTAQYSPLGRALQSISYKRQSPTKIL